MAVARQRRAWRGKVGTSVGNRREVATPNVSIRDLSLRIGVVAEPVVVDGKLTVAVVTKP